MKTSIISSALETIKDDVIVAGMFEGRKKLAGAAAEIDRATSGLISAAGSDITGKLHQTTMLYPSKGLASACCPMRVCVPSDAVITR